MNNGADRADFEQYAHQMGKRDFEQNEFGDYRNPFTQEPWNFWRASRQALSEQQIEEMLEQYIPGKRGHSIPSLAKQYGVSKSHIHRLIHGKAGPKRRNSRAGEAS
jgi:hypothetical protein